MNPTGVQRRNLYLQPSGLGGEDVNEPRMSLVRGRQPKRSLAFFALTRLFEPSEKTAAWRPSASIASDTGQGFAGRFNSRPISSAIALSCASPFSAKKKL